MTREEMVAGRDKMVLVQTGRPALKGVERG
jgi:hypothetical protein